MTTPLVTVMTSSENMNLFLAGNPYSTRKPVRCLELFMQYVCVFTHECIYAGLFSLCLVPLETYFGTAAHFWVCFRRLFALCNHI